MNQQRGMKIGLAGFVIALVGAAIGFSGFEIDQRWLSIIGFVTTVAGVAVGFIGIVYGWITVGKHSITGGLEITKKLHNKAVRPESRRQ